jgi:hypothetical protein
MPLWAIITVGNWSPIHRGHHYLSLPFNVYRQDRHINPRSRLHRPTWVSPISVTPLPQRQGMPRQTQGIRRPGMALTSTVLPLRTAVHPNRLSSRAPGPLRPIPWVGQALGYMVSAPRRPFPVQCLSMAETDPVPHRPSPAVSPRPNTPNRSIVPVLHRPSPEHLLPLTAGSPASHTLMLLMRCRGPRVSAVART